MADCYVLPWLVFRKSQTKILVTEEKPDASLAFFFEYPPDIVATRLAGFGKARHAEMTALDLFLLEDFYAISQPRIIANR